ncbi:hypothetical protein AN619_11010 [Thermotalea metallivorans]|uniref:Uncharacterized protein n=1 Tax=Thermotalea metallivorans TaxID=520762 RepID=A0A140L6G9_9FIRM|nr:hypothetical protein AN619_11010 [Thermotalea metallivorans]
MLNNHEFCYNVANVGFREEVDHECWHHKLLCYKAY